MAKKPMYMVVGGKPMLVAQDGGDFSDAEIIDAIEIGNQMGGGNVGGGNLPGVIPGPQQTAQRLGLSPFKLNLKFTRLTNDIPETLWLPLFGSINQLTDYVPVYNRLNVLNGMTVAFEILQNGDAQVTFTKNGQTDICIIHSTTLTNYSEILQMIGSGGYFTCNKIRYDGGSNYAKQFASGDILATVNTLTGLTTGDSADVAGEKSPEQFQNPIIDVMVNLAVDSVYTLMIPVEEDTEEFYFYFKNVKFKSPAQFSRACG